MSCLTREQGALENILAKTEPNLFMRDEHDNDTFVAVPFAENLSKKANTMHDPSKSVLSLQCLGKLFSNTIRFLTDCKTCAGKGWYYPLDLETAEPVSCRDCKELARGTLQWLKDTVSKTMYWRFLPKTIRLCPKGKKETDRAFRN